MIHIFARLRIKFPRFSFDPDSSSTFGISTAKKAFFWSGRKFFQRGRDGLRAVRLIIFAPITSKPGDKWDGTEAIPP